MDNKPLETDDQEESIENLFEETPEETPQEPGAEDVGGKSDFTKKLEELSGRTFKDDADAEKHYVNLKGFVGKRQEVKEAPKPEMKQEADFISKQEFEDYKATQMFLKTTPQAEQHLDLVQSVSKADGIPINEAWAKVEEYVGAFEASKKEKTVVDSKNRPNVPQNKEFQSLADKARNEGLTSSEQAELVKKWGAV